MSITENKTSTFMLSWSRASQTSQAVKLAPMATKWCKVDGVIFNDMSMGRAACWRSVLVTPESFKICMTFIAGCWVSVGNVWNHFLIVAAESLQVGNVWAQEKKHATFSKRKATKHHHHRQKYTLAFGGRLLQPLAPKVLMPLEAETSWAASAASSPP